MQEERPHVLSIAGFDPSAGAGILADIKTFEANRVYGLGVVTALTLQDDRTFSRVDWVPVSHIKEQVQLLASRFRFSFVKIGLIESLQVLKEIVVLLKEALPDGRIIWDPVLKSSTGFAFHHDLDRKLLESLLPDIYLLTPNMPEALLLGSTASEPEENARLLSRLCNVLLKGGHRSAEQGLDLLFRTNGETDLLPAATEARYEKHGSGCVLSSAITANLAKGIELKDACTLAKSHIVRYLNSSPHLLGFHHE